MFQENKPAWDRGALKRRAKESVNRNYRRTVFVCLILAVLAGAHWNMKSNVGVGGAPTAPNALRLISNNIITDSFWNSLISGSDIPTPNAETVGATRGVLSSLFNSTTQSGSFLFGVLNAINKSFFNGKLMAGVIIFLGSALGFLCWYYVGNTLRVGEARFFLENHSYSASPIGRILFLFKIRRVNKVSGIMFFRTLYIALWSITVIGGFIAYYSYRMIPFILAENPDIGKKEAFDLSKKMMDGQKWNTFLLDISFALWHILNMLSFGLLGYSYLNSYTTAAIAELYIVLRQDAIDKRLPDSELLNDCCLIDVPNGISAAQYPVERFPIAENDGRKWLAVDYHKHYSVWNLTILFFLFSISGWLWEVFVTILADGSFVNKGTMFGPWLPIYGVGGVLIILLVGRWIDKPVLVFGITMALCAAIEYIGGWYLESFRGAKWWDYSGYLLNIQGRICLEGLLIFGIGGCLGIYYFAPLLDERMNKISKKHRIMACMALTALFAADFIYSSVHPNVGVDITYP